MEPSDETKQTRSRRRNSGHRGILEPETTENQELSSPYGIAGDPNDESAWLAQYREGDNTAIETYPFVPGFDKASGISTSFAPTR
jgi:hypothetical protein